MFQLTVLRAAAESGPLAGSQLCEPEMAFALNQKVLRGEIRKGAAKKAYERFRRDVKQVRWRLIPVGGDVLAESASLAWACYGRRKPVALRTLDGLHLAAARLQRCDRLATSDRRLGEAGRVVGFEVVTPGET